MHFKLFLEALDSKIDYDVKALSRLFRTRAKIGDREIVFTAEYTSSSKDGELWEVDFKEVSDGDSTFDATGSGNEFQVFAMVEASLKDFIARYTPGAIMLSAKETGEKKTREAIYTRILKRSGYHLTSTSTPSSGIKILTYVRKEQIKEAFDMPYSTKLALKRDGLWAATFEAGDRTIEVEFESEESESDWTVSFVERQNGKPSSLQITGSGDEFKVFATVIKTIEDFIKKVNPSSLSFTAEKSDKNRAKLYDKMIRRLKPDGYKLSIEHKRSDYRSYFTLEKE